MKKRICLLLAACLLLTMAACGKTPVVSSGAETPASSGTTEGPGTTTDTNTPTETTPSGDSSTPAGQSGPTEPEPSSDPGTTPEAEDEDGQNPVMNYIGPYVSNRARALVEAEGADGARITIEWPDSVSTLHRWVITGPLDWETKSVTYSDCTESLITYDGEGNVASEETLRDFCSGTVTFGADGTFAWHEASYHRADMVFEWAWQAVGIDYLALVNKLNPLPYGWEEALETVTVTNSVGDSVEVEARAYEAYLLLKADLEENEGIYLELDSARRSVAAQQDIMDRFTEKYGADYAAKTVAQPGYSEHHTGLALDLYFRLRDENGEFSDVYYNEDMVQYPEIWEKIHARLADYGFILRYLEGREHITGYGYEPWHIRYLDDVEVAREIMAEDITLEEYLAGYRYPEVEIDLGSSQIFTEEELAEAIVQIKCRFAYFAYCELHSLTYAGDGVNNEENLAWMNMLGDGEEFAQVISFTSSFHTDPERSSGSFAPDFEYTGWQWWLARTADGGWQLLTWGY